MRTGGTARPGCRTPRMRGKVVNLSQVNCRLRAWVGACCPGDGELMAFHEFDETPIEDWASVRPSDDSMYMNHSCNPACTSSW